MSILISILIYMILEHTMLMCMCKRYLKIPEHYWLLAGKIVIFFWIAIDLFLIDGPCRSGMVCKDTTNMFVFYCIYVTLLYLAGYMFKSNAVKRVLNIFISSGFFILYSFKHDFCKKPDMRCIVYTRPHIIMYAVLLIIFMIIETIILVLMEGKNDGYQNVNHKESAE